MGNVVAWESSVTAPDGNRASFADCCEKCWLVEEESTRSKNGSGPGSVLQGNSLGGRGRLAG